MHNGHHAIHLEGAAPRVTRLPALPAIVKHSFPLPVLSLSWAVSELSVFAMRTHRDPSGRCFVPLPPEDRVTRREHTPFL